jgi:hypothetical protein
VLQLIQFLTLQPMKLDAVSNSLKSEYGWILAGYERNIDGTDSARLSLVPVDGAQAIYMDIAEGFVRQFFEKDDEYYALLSNGETLKVDSGGFTETEFRFKPDSLLIAVDPEMIACTKTGILSKANCLEPRGCYRVDGTWDTSAYWTRKDVPPQICDGELKVLTGAAHLKKWEVISIDPQTGDIISTREVSTPEGGASVCQL